MSRHNPHAARFGADWLEARTGVRPTRFQVDALAALIHNIQSATTAISECFMTVLPVVADCHNALAEAVAEAQEGDRDDQEDQ